MDASITMQLFWVALSILVPVVEAKGGGKGSSNGKSKGSTKTKSGNKIIYVGSGKSTVCKDSVTNQMVPCPSSSSKKGAIIAAAIISSVVGAALVAALMYWIVKRRRNKRKVAEKVTTVPAVDAQTSVKGRYFRLSNTPSDEPKV